VGGRLAAVSNLTTAERAAKLVKWSRLSASRSRQKGKRCAVGVRLQSHEGDVSTCHVVVITCAAVAARLVVVTLVRRSGARDVRGRRDCRSCEGGEGRRYGFDFRLENAFLI